jgi:hypothetical protein
LTVENITVELKTGSNIIENNKNLFLILSNLPNKVAIIREFRINNERLINK